MRAVRLRADGRLRAGPRGAGEAGLCGQRANSAGAVRRLPQQDAARERAAHKFGEPRGPRRHGERPEFQAKAQTTARTSAWTWCAVLPDLGFVEGCCDARQSCLPVAVRGARLVPEGFAGRDAGAGRLPLGHIVLGISARSHMDAATLRRALERMDAAWPEGEEHMAKLSVNAMTVGAQHGGAGRRGCGLLSGLRLREGHGVGLRLRQEAAEQRHLPPHPRRGAGLRALHGGQGPAHLGRAAAPPCAGEDGLPADAAAAEALRGAAAGVGGAAPPGRHAGLPRGKDEAVAGQPGAAHGGGAAQTTEGGRPYKPLPGGQLPAAHGPAGHRKDAPGPDHCCEAARAGTIRDTGP